MRCIASLQELMEKQIVMTNGFKDLEAAAIGGYAMRK
jgi:hypothetical protein